MGLTALGLLLIGLVNCVIVTQRKSKISFRLSCIVQGAFLGASGDSAPRAALSGSVGALLLGSRHLCSLGPLGLS